MAIAHPIVKNQRSRRRDEWGSGQFGARREGGRREHQGLDIEVRPNEEIFAPVPGTVIREAVPYRDDPRYRGVVIRGTGAWLGYEVRIFYVAGFLSGPVVAGQAIGHAQDLTLRYPGISNHLHIEVRKHGRLLSPNELWAQCF